MTHLLTVPKPITLEDVVTKLPAARQESIRRRANELIREELQAQNKNEPVMLEVPDVIARWLLVAVVVVFIIFVAPVTTMFLARIIGAVLGWFS